MKGPSVTSGPTISSSLSSSTELAESELELESESELDSVCEESEELSIGLASLLIAALAAASRALSETG